ncbi:conserved hypothetical protein [Uncinocarpus reesii 1704]|uniref:Uncharacterized protein n=1 Tax=Uncinocarpus reesii (strain UAMH 1704) TaxID=336963 RepID=C4JUT6_UNCRE|nr:uncharacterized protein UREG_04889 [Uncinocarpus reesii 1704]EEP80047.1 conserved hypothetical protein [Uncinocarpus reesii 1704]
MDLSKQCSLSSKWSLRNIQAIDVLLKSGFCMEAPFKVGLRYISREEEQAAKARVRDRKTRLAAMDDINHDNLDAESVAFLAETRRAIDDWVGIPNKKVNYVNIPGPEKRSASPSGINNYQKRLVHQLVRSEYPDLVSIGKSTFIQVIRYDQQRENSVQEARMRRVREHIFHQTGFRWIVEAMVGGDLSRLPPQTFVDPSCGSPRREEKILENYDYMQAKLRSKHLILVGHNLFTDLVNFYKCFFGSLPDKVEEFLATIHEIFPTIVDTKYLATHDCGSDFPSSMLEELDDKLNAKERPTITVDPDHPNYNDQKPLHEAGYDSLMTARVFLRLAAQLSEEGEHIVATGNGSQHGTQDAGDKLESRTTGLSPNATDIPPSSSIKSTVVIRGLDNHGGPAGVPSHQIAIAHTTKFDILVDRMDDDEPDDLDSEGYVFEDDPFLTSGGNPAVESKVKNGQLIPRLDSEFWKVYGNKLRMFGTAQRFCELKD